MRIRSLQIALVLAVASMALAGCIKPATEATDADVSSSASQPVEPTPAPPVKVPGPAPQQ